MPLTTITWRARAVSAPSARRASPPSISTAKPRPGPPDSIAERSRNEIVAGGLLAEQRDGGERRRVEHEIARVVGRDAVGVGDGDARHPARGQPRRQPHRRGPARLDRHRGVGHGSIVDGEHDLRLVRADAVVGDFGDQRIRLTPGRADGEVLDRPADVDDVQRQAVGDGAGRILDLEIADQDEPPLAAPARRVAALHSGVSAVPPLPAVSVAMATRAAPRSRLGSARTTARSSTRMSASRSPEGAAAMARSAASFALAIRPGAPMLNEVSTATMVIPPTASSPRM